MNNGKQESWLLKAWLYLKQGFLSLLKEPVFYIYLIGVVIFLPLFLPNISDIGTWDETYYMVNGKKIFSGKWPLLADGPLLNVLSALFYLFFRRSPFWLIHVNSLLRFFLFSFLFVGTWQVAKAFKAYFNPVVLFGFLFVSPLLTQNFEYPADLLFAPLSAIAFSQAFHFVRSRKIKHVWWASFWLGLGMLTRGDAIILLIALSVFVVWVGVKHHRWWRLILAALIPFLSLSVGYVLLRGAITGDFETGMSQRSYMAFEQGQEVDMAETAGSFGAPIESYHVARTLFGTPEENEYSVFRAIGRNPEAYWSRIKQVVKSLPGLYLTAYNRRDAIFLGLLAFRGVINLLKKKDYSLVMLCLIWVLPLSAGIARTLLRVGYFRLFYFVLYLLAIIGLKALLDSLKQTREVWAWVGALGAALVLAGIIQDGAIQIAMIVYLCWLLLAYLLSRRSTRIPNWQWMVMLLLLASSFFLKTSVEIFTPRTLGAEAGEAASLAIRKFTDPQDYVLTCTPSVVFMADRQVANFCSADIPEFDSSEALIDWMRAQNFKAIFLDSTSPSILREFSMEQRSITLAQVFRSLDSSAFVFILLEEE